jgi:glycosyltransferase involved in cell wall biosynthesis
MLPVSVVVIARDEADRIGRCLASLPDAAERLVLDSGSTDRTVAVARAAGARVVETDWPGHVAQKNRAMAMATQPWVLSLDADEWLSERAEDEVRRVVASGRADGFSFPRLSTWLGTPLRHGRWYPDRRIRLVRRAHARWIGDDPHDHLEVDGRVEALTGDIHHVPYRDLSEHLRTIDRYTKIQAEALVRRGVRGRRRDVLLRPPFHLFQALVVGGGVLDGVPGVAVAGLGATHVLCKWLRVRELQGSRS